MRYGAFLLNMSSRDLFDMICQDQEARNTCLRQLALRRDARPYLIKLLRHNDPLIRRATIKQLSIDHAFALKRLLTSSLGDSDSRVRSEAIQCLSKIGVRDLPEILAGSIDDRDPQVRISALKALGRAGDTAATGAVAGRLLDSRQSVRMAAAEALMNLPGNQALGPLAKAFSDSSAAIRLQIIRVVGKHGYESLADKVATACRDDNHAVREAAVVALGELAIESTIPTLLAAIEHSTDSALHVRALEALANFRDRDTAACLVAKLSDRDVDVRCAAADVLAIRHEQEATQSLVEAIKKESDSSAKRHMRKCLESLRKSHAEAETAAGDSLLGTWYSSPSMDAGSLIYTFSQDGRGEFEDFMMGITRNKLEFRYFKKPGLLEFLPRGKKRKRKSRFSITRSSYYQQAAGSLPCLKLVFEKEPFFRGLRPGKSTYYRILR